MHQRLSQHVCLALGCPAAPGKVHSGRGTVQNHEISDFLAACPAAPKKQLARGEEISGMLKHSWLSWWPCLVHDLFAGAAGRLGEGWGLSCTPKVPGLMAWAGQKEGQDGLSRGTRWHLRAPRWCFHPDKPSTREEEEEEGDEEEVAWQNPSPQQQTLPKAGKLPQKSTTPTCPRVPGEVAALWSAWDSGRIPEWHEEDSGGAGRKP